MTEKIIDHLKQEYIERCFHNVKGINREKPGYYERSVFKVANAITQDTKILEDGIIDSFGLATFRNWLEQEYNVDLPDEIVTPITFATVNDIIKLLKEKGA